MARELSAVILAAGHGTRMKSTTPKVLHPVAGLAMLGHVMAAARALSPAHTCVVIGDHAPEVGEAARAVDAAVGVAIQAPPQGTGDAVGKALPFLADFEGVVVVLYADTPLIRPVTIASLAATVDAQTAVGVLGFHAEDPGAYGRLVLDADGGLAKIVEAKDAGPEELAIDLVNSGVMAIDAAFLREALPKIGNDNAKGEYYLTDIVEIARKAGKLCAVVRGEEDEVYGVNSRVELAVAEEIWQDRRRLSAMQDGVTLIDPSTVYFAHDTAVDQDVVIEPGVYFGPGVSVKRFARIKAYSHLEGAQIGEGAQVGPFARLRPGAIVGDEAKIGNFVEIKNCDVGADAKVSHLTYLGDAAVGASANIGAGTITCNYDGYAKFRTTIGEGAFIGSNASLVAPVSVGAGAYVGSGSVVTENVEPDALAVARGRQTTKPGWAKAFRKRNENKEAGS